MKRPSPAVLLAVVCLSVTALSLRAQDSPPRHLQPKANATHYGSSPFNPPDIDDTLFVVDQGPGLDTGCTYRSGGPLQIHVPIKRAVGTVDGFGYLADAPAFKARGLISPYAKLIVPAYDIDVHGGSGSVPNEVDRIFFNGHDLGTLTGDNNIWKLNEFSIPIEWIRFPQPSMGGPAQDEPTGSEPTPADNVITISIDEASAPYEYWCMAVDWVQLQFNAIAPIFLVHGIAADSTTWDSGFASFLQDAGVPYSRNINLEKNGTIAGNGALLNARLATLVKAFGAKKCHIIAHSKGGLDTREFTNRYYNPSAYKLLSVSTLSTPYRGSVLADIVAAAREKPDPQSKNSDIDRLIYWNGVFPPESPGLDNLQVTFMGSYNSLNPLRTDIRWWGWGANADANGNGTIDVPAETAGMIPTWPPDNIIKKVTNSTYNILAYVETVKITTVTKMWGLNQDTFIEPGTMYGFKVPNDLSVNTLSATPLPGGSFNGSFQANHSTMKSYSAAQSLLNNIVSQFPNP